MRLLKFIIPLLFLASCSNDLDKQYLNAEADEQVMLDISKGDYRAREVKYLVVHCTATDPSRPWSKQRLLDFFYNERGWSKPGYNYYIPQGGEIDELAPINEDCIVDFDEVVYGVKGYNSVTFNISLEGGVTTKNGKLVIEDNFTLEQRISLIYLVDKIRKICPEIEVLGHRDLDRGKACPVLDIEFLD
jgi:N-acetylmuramoyl-L-alanine amidase